MFAFCRSGRELQRSSRVVLTLVALGVTVLAHGQPPGEPADAALSPPAHISVADGEAIISRDTEVIAAAAGEPVVPGDGLRTGAGRAELWFSNGSTLALDAQSAIELHAESLVHLTAGRALLVVSRTDAERGAVVPYRVDTPLASVAIAEAGEYIIALSGTHVELAVVRGSAELTTDDGAMRVRSGERTRAAADGPPAHPERFNAAPTGEFERWVESVHDAQRGRATSAQYLPDNLRMYGPMLDRDGSWSYEPAYGYVWYPIVDSAWRPYYRGVWRSVPGHGWTWAGADRWGWATHHYGRWGLGRSRWFWIPDRRFSPAWVSWASAADYVGWCPLGFDNRPIVGFSLSIGNAWAAWVVMPRRSFGARDADVARHAFDGRRLPPTTPFALHARAPIAPRPSQRRDTGLGDDSRSDRAIGGAARPGNTRIAARDGERGRSTATATSDGWRMPLPPMAIPRGGARLDRTERDTTPTERRDPRADRTEGAGRGERRLPDNGDGMILLYPGGGVSNGPRRGHRADSPAPPADDRPTPMAPRNGVFVSPGVAGPQLPADPGFGRQRAEPPAGPPSPGRAQPRTDRGGDRGGPRGRDHGAPGGAAGPAPQSGAGDGGAGVRDGRGGGAHGRGAR